MARRTDKGFTLVEAIIVVVVIVVILAVTIPWMRERERARLQALADNEPWEVFELRAVPAQESFARSDDVVVECEIRNLTEYPLSIEGLMSGWGIFLTFEDSDMLVGIVSEADVDLPMGASMWDITIEVALAWAAEAGMIPDPVIGPGDSVTFQLPIWGVGVGGEIVRATFWTGKELRTKKNPPYEKSFRSNKFLVKIEQNAAADVKSEPKADQ